MKQKRWYKGSRTGLIAQGCAASPLYSLADFRETCVCSVLTWHIQHLAGSEPCLLYIFIYLFGLPFSAAPILCMAAQSWEDNTLSPGSRCIAACPSFCPIHGEWKVTERKGTKQELGSLCPKDTGRAALSHHKFLLAASTCLRTELFCSPFVAPKDTDQGS